MGGQAEHVFGRGMHFSAQPMAKPAVPEYRRAGSMFADDVGRGKELRVHLDGRVRLLSDHIVDRRTCRLGGGGR